MLPVKQCGAARVTHFSKWIVVNDSLVLVLHVFLVLLPGAVEIVVCIPTMLLVVLNMTCQLLWVSPSIRCFHVGPLFLDMC